MGALAVPGRERFATAGRVPVGANRGRSDYRRRHKEAVAIYLPMAYAKAGREDVTPAGKWVWSRPGGGDAAGRSEMTAERTQLGLEVEAALNEVLSHVRGEAELPCRIVDDPSVGGVRVLHERMGLSRREFALDARAVQDWEQGRPNPNRAARALGS